ncbi:hypothetical protein A2773_06785 [Candidatus Gottesmanbacteria bacterium RIFCSPHIGHO2_01_FULL_39_10]|uniref:Carbonic anhydrase n=1 Tax=Candidatus Gottesmanbacteria bacterium RIFCSPHIGHO2_01_FULL_39_10 TaxID=1798375 RepID=A0A1F5ZPM5_9BACT|nr:MAG: hypothetical protein A2773_06785 [Candidatus Gottesmanbacteria bacterium RIFCSPHIGHO2_01_FULL_39_10]
MADKAIVGCMQSDLRAVVDALMAHLQWEEPYPISIAGGAAVPEAVAEISRSLNTFQRKGGKAVLLTGHEECAAGGTFSYLMDNAKEIQARFQHLTVIAFWFHRVEPGQRGFDGWTFRRVPL